MKANRSFLTCFLVVASMTALNVVSQYYLCEKTLNIVAFTLTGLATLILLNFQANSIYRQYNQAKVVANRRYVLVKLARADNGRGKVEMLGALLAFWDENEKKQFFFFKDVEFSSEADLCHHNRFVGVAVGKKVILSPIN